MQRSRSLLTAVAAVGLTLSVGLSACGSDDDKDASTKVNDETATTVAKADPAADTKGFCTDYVTANLAINGMPGNQGGPDAPQPSKAELKSWYEKNLADTITSIKGEVPEAISSDMAAMLDAVTPIGVSGDASKMGSPAVAESQTKVDAWVTDSCDNVTVHDVKAVDYGYVGLPKTAEAGTTAFVLTNTSAHGEMHEMAIVRKNDGVTKSFTELLQLPDDQAMKNIEIKGMTFAEPGKVGTGYADLDPGQYLAICFIPKGASEAKPDGDGPPHFMLGMQQEFTVK
jgi:hypothetical protein